MATKYRFHFKDGSTKVGYGDTAAKAFTQLNIGEEASRGVSFYERIKKKGINHDPNKKRD